ncbi:hypothetical protein CDAR_405991 [Caerostris darwini]|uniref:Uncharacterized protein n=1 Tax=Caerostris darwini TaxID=1538125 RepID=A0AAV4TN14_9ARAC|nr:hypothetical protein CDAR_405991 [Caerostris darwini]
MSPRHSLARLIRTTKATLRNSQHAHSASELTNRKKYYRALARPTNAGDVCLECCAWKPFPLSTPIGADVYSSCVDCPLDDSQAIRAPKIHTTAGWR